jgi:hypothetical protein
MYVVNYGSGSLSIAVPFHCVKPAISSTEIYAITGIIAVIAMIA